ncbi:LANO_0D08328g1_1 [Lachancea nothofagi CBS 11611]|uniref:1-phosphatidylinositol 4-kinase n=1 Tax=Lachancea nothofagi CBS 11611 TaxID=1266666 RepID=A0A1G4JIN3_9SACH|nr:LANO_0D08328g1_1 [Lachancea nothofagi CBS 11611]
MSYFRESNGSLRALALARLARNSKACETGNSLEKLLASLPVSYSSNPVKLFSIPLTLNELEVLLAICKSTPSGEIQARSLLKKCIFPYFLASPKQKFTDFVLNKYRQRNLKHPGQVLSFELARCIIRANRMYPQLLPETCRLVDEYLQIVSDGMTVEGLLSLAGFFEALILEKGKSLTSVLISTLRTFLTEDFLQAVEMTTRTSSSKDILIFYFDRNREISSLLFCELIEKLQVAYACHLLAVPERDSLDTYLLKLQHQHTKNDKSSLFEEFSDALLKHKAELLELCAFSFKQMTEIEQGAKYIDFSSQSRLEFALRSKSYMLQILALGVFIGFELEEFTEIVRDSVVDLPTNHCALGTDLFATVVTVASLLNYFTEAVSSDLLRVFPVLVSTKSISKQQILAISTSFARGLVPLTEDAIVGTIYTINNLLALAQDGPTVKGRRLTTALGNGTNFDRFLSSRPTRSNTVATYQSLQRLKLSEINIEGQQFSYEGQAAKFQDEDNSSPYHNELFENVITATTTIAAIYNDQSITALTITILTQKYRSVSPQLDKGILEGLAHLALTVNKSEFNLLMKFFHTATNRALENKDSTMTSSLVSAKIVIANGLSAEKPRGPLFRIYLDYLLDSIVARGDVDRSEHHRSHTEISEVAEQIALYLKPLAALLPKPGSKPISLMHDEALTNTFRNVWYNAAVHGFHGEAPLSRKHHKELSIIAYNSPPLASDFPAVNRETSLEMNTILRRGSSNHNLKEQKHILSDFLSISSVQARTLSSSKIMFLAATLLLENLRCEAGDCSKALLYCSDRSIAKSNIDKFVSSISMAMIQKYTMLVIQGTSQNFCAENVARQLNNIILLLTHRDTSLQDAAYLCCDKFIERIPSSLCHRDSLYTLLDLLSMLFDSVVSCEANKHEVVFEFTLKHSQRKVMLPDSYHWRSLTLEKLQKYATRWVTVILKTANQDTKILLQSYISDLGSIQRLNNVEFGVSFALEMAAKILPVDRELASITRSGYRRPDSMSGFLSQHAWRSRFMREQSTISSFHDIDVERSSLKSRIEEALAKNKSLNYRDISAFLDLSASLLVLRKGNAATLVYDIVNVPFMVSTSDAVKIATNVWLSVMKERSDISYLLLSEIGNCWASSIDNNEGLFSTHHNLVVEEFQPMQYAPYNKKEINARAHSASKSLQPHMLIIRFLTSHFEGTMFDSLHLLQIFTKICLQGLTNLVKASSHPFARMARNELLNFGVLVFSINVKHKTRYVPDISRALVNGALSWFEKPNSWPFGANELKIRADLAMLIELYKKLKKNESALNDYNPRELTLLEYFMLSEIHSVESWLRPLAKPQDITKLPLELISFAFTKNPLLAQNLIDRFPSKKADELLQRMIVESPLQCVHSPKSLAPFLAGAKDFHYTLYWASTSPLQSINLFLPQYAQNRFVVQYNTRALESHDVNLTFFYVPQIVQCLRSDPLGYVERFIIDTAKISVLFAHQIIWNMLANSFKDDEGEIPDDLKPCLDRIHEKMVASFSDKQRGFYEREFDFFNEVTGISGKLRPFIKKTKAEKKLKIDEEMAKIVVRDGVYLPSNPDGVVVDIDRSSGKPLQSHAKAPFMATFKIEKTIQEVETEEPQKVEKWQAAIFKVGDDCRQDVLALQLVSLFRTIWSCIGLDVYVFPYRVTATAPGCGVIDVLPNSISRDMLGREAVNGLYEYFITKFGHENTAEFQKARNNFVKSLAGYSVISYLLQFKDRHNGNIMYDDQGHCLHIDFGFIFDIVPGGVKFEAVPFKLTKEMVKVMGGSPDTQAYQEFEELCIKAYLAARPHMSAILELVRPMLSSGLPCFKGEKTMRNLEARFVPHKSEHEAAEFMMGLIKKSYESIFTKGYDEFQRLTNGIPY